MDYAYDLPSDEQARQLRTDLVDANQRRNEAMDRMRAIANGKNKIKFPVAAQYKAQVWHSWLLRGAVNEKVTRFKKQPQFQVTPRKNARGDVSREAQERSSRMEQWYASAMHWQDQGGSPIWPRHYEDIFTYFMACHRIESLVNVAWPELVPDENGEDMLIRKGLTGKDYDREKEALKQKALPFRTVYVPPDAVYPLYEDNDVPSLVIEFERRSLAEVLRNPLYRDSAFVQSMRDSGRMRLPTEKVTVMHLSNRIIHAYYALAPSNSYTEKDRFPTGTELSKEAGGVPMLLYHYEHGLGRPIYNIGYGAFGTWHGDTSSLEGRLNAAADLCEDADLLVSQAATAVRSLYWPSFVHKISPLHRDSTESQPKARQVDEGENIPIWADEDIRPLMGGVDVSALQWLYEERVQRFREIMGAAVLYGQHQEGASTGYHEQVLMDQAKSLDALFEIGMARMAVEWAQIINRYILKWKEPVPARVISENKGKRVAEYITLSPKDLNPLPEIDARVIAPKAADMAQASTTAARLLSPVGVENVPLFSRQTVQQEILGIPNPDEEDRAIYIAKAEQTLMSDPLIADMARQKFFQVIMKAEMPSTPSPDEYGMADPAVAAAGNMAMPEATAMGGYSPDNMLSMMQEPMGPMGAPPMPNAGFTQGLGGGLPAGMAQPDQVQGNTERLMAGV